MEGVIVRRAILEDAAEIANVHTNSWREAYLGLLPQDYLDDRPLTFKNRYNLWQKVVLNSEQFTLVAETKEHGIVGFINGGAGRDKKFENYIEVYSFYLLKRYHGKKIGCNLLKEYFHLNSTLGQDRCYLWVLENNPTIKFYEKSGGVYNNLTKVDEIAGQKVKELMYVWEKLL